VLDLDGDGAELTGRSSISPLFDVDGDFYGERTGWVRPDDGLLVRDLDGNGTIDDITEMFGTTPSARSATKAKQFSLHAMSGFTERRAA